MNYDDTLPLPGDGRTDHWALVFLLQAAGIDSTFVRERWTHA